MAEKFVEAKVKDNYEVETHIEGFSYTMDYTERTPDLISKGTSPTGMLLVSLAGCHLMTAVSYLNMKKIAFSVLNAQLDGDFIDEKPEWRLDAEVIVETDANLDDSQLAGLERFIHRHCKVSSILSKGNNIKLSFKLV